MVRLLTITLLAMALAGCSGRNVKVDHPVVGPPPPRIRPESSLAESEPTRTAEVEGSEAIRLASATGIDDAGPIPMTAVAARVNGQPILVGTVLSQGRARLKQIESQLTPSQYARYRQVQMEGISEFLPGHIEQALMVQAVRAKLKEEQLKSITEQLDKGFQSYLHDQVIPKMPPGSTFADVEAMLQQQGLTLQVMHDMWSDRAIASEFMKSQLEAPVPVTAPELRAAYHEQLADFAVPEAIKWQQIQISFANYPSKAEAQAVVAEAAESLRKGASFDDVVRKYSDGADAANGGHWDWTETESLTAELRGPLSKLPPHTPSGPIETGKNIQIVQIEERRPARTKAFEEVQGDIKKALQEQRQQAKFKKVIEDLKAKAVIETILDDPTASGSASPAESEGL